MARKRSKENAEKKTKKIKYTLIERVTGGRVALAYKVAEKLIDDYHSDLREGEARVLVAWDASPAKEDVDGKVKFGRTKLGDDFDRRRKENPFDVLLIIRKDLFNSFSEERQFAELDRMLCKVAVVRDKHGEIYVDDEGRSVFRLRQPIQVFKENVMRFGWYQEPTLADVKDAKRPLLNEDDKAEKPKRGQGFADPAVPPKAETNGHAHTNGHAKTDPWGLDIDVLELPAAITSALRLASIEKVKDLATHEESGFAGISGIGPGCAEVIAGLLKKFRKEYDLAASK